MRAASTCTLSCLWVLALGTNARAQAPRVVTEEARLLGGDPWQNEHWGVAVACSADGTRVVIGSTGLGARILARVAGDWQLEHAMRPTDRGHASGTAVAMSADGRVVAVGAPLDGAGTVRVLVRDDAGWHLDAELQSAVPRRGDRFGGSVALSADGERLFVGAPLVAGSGAVFVFARRPVGWTEIAMLTRTTRAAGDAFGCAIATSADGATLLAGACAADPTGVRNAGVAAVLTLDAEAHVTHRALLAPSPMASESFGTSVALSGDGTRAVIGAPRARTGDLGNAGAAYVFERRASGWELQARAAGLERNGALGRAVAIAADGSSVLVGEVGASFVHVLERTADGWVELRDAIPRVGPAHVSRERTDFGGALASSADGSRIAIGAPWRSVEGWRQTGAVYAMTLAAPAARTAHVVDVDARLDATTREELARPHRTAAQDAEIRLGGALTMASGGVSVVVGAFVVIAGFLSNRTCRTAFYFTFCDYRTDDGLVAAGAVTGGIGALLLVAGGAIYSQHTQGPLHPRFALVPTEEGALATMSLMF